jgi:PmbA protein
MGSSPVDDEGVPAQEKVIIREGVLVNYLYNTFTAKRDGTASTGNAVRGSYAALPSVGVTNFFIDAASRDCVRPGNRLFDAIDKGLFVVDAMGVHTANPISGEFSIGVSGLWIEHGEITYPVKEAVISGNILEFFGKIEAAADDIRFYGNIGSPSLIIHDVDISA